MNIFSLLFSNSRKRRENILLSLKGENRGFLALGGLFKPNRYSIFGMLLLIIGFFLTPFLVGFLIMPVGALLLVFGVHYSIYQMIPGHRRLTKKIIEAYRPFFRKRRI